MSAPLSHCGLDFGTSNTTLGIARGNAPARLLPLEDSKPTIPSTIFFDFDDDRTLYGRAAIAEYISGSDGRMMRSLKSILGSTLAEERVRIKKRFISYLDIIGGYVGELKARAEANPLVLKDPAPAVELTGLSEAFVELTVRAWVQAADFATVKADLMLAARLFAEGAAQLPELPKPKAKPAAAPRRRKSLRDRLTPPAE